MDKKTIIGIINRVFTTLKIKNADMKNNTKNIYSRNDWGGNHSIFDCVCDQRLFGLMGYLSEDDVCVLYLSIQVIVTNDLKLFENVPYLSNIFPGKHGSGTAWVTYIKRFMWEDYAQDIDIEQNGIKPTKIKIPGGKFNTKHQKYLDICDLTAEIIYAYFTKFI